MVETLGFRQSGSKAQDFCLQLRAVANIAAFNQKQQFPLSFLARSSADKSSSEGQSHMETRSSKSLECIWNTLGVASDSGSEVQSQVTPKTSSWFRRHGIASENDHFWRMLYCRQSQRYCPFEVQAWVLLPATVVSNLRFLPHACITLTPDQEDTRY